MKPFGSYVFIFGKDALRINKIDGLLQFCKRLYSTSQEWLLSNVMRQICLLLM